MRWIKRILLGFFALLVLSVAVVATVFWFKPLGINNYINKVTIQLALQSPEIISQLGIIDNTVLDFHSGKLGDYTAEFELEALEFLKDARAGLDNYGPDGLEGQELLSYEIFAWFLDDLLRNYEVEHSRYFINQLTGPTVDLPQFLTDVHQIVDEKSVERYLSRVGEYGRVLSESQTRVEASRDAGTVPPDFIIDKVLVGLNSFIEGGALENPLVTTLAPKLDRIELEAEQAADYIARAEALVSKDIIPAYESLISLFESLKTSTDSNAGIWRLPEGEKIYANALLSHTTTNLTAEEIHSIGFREVARINQDMNAILVAEGLVEGTVAERVRILMERPDQIFPNTDAGREQMIEHLHTLNDALMVKARDYFITLPPEPLDIQRVPEYAQDSAPGGYYNPPALDGSRNGTFYINQKDTADNPKWTLPTLMYHEGAPGHHFQIALAQNIEGLPFIRQQTLFTAYAEGWALYSEWMVSKDMGVYDQDRLGDLGRLQAEMFRAVRLVVDTGMHAKQWTREQAIDYMVSNTGMTNAEVTREIERYVVLPGQATAYKTGMLAMQRMRAQAEASLGEDFNASEFHDLLLKNGAMPLNILSGIVDDWLGEKRAD